MGQDTTQIRVAADGKILVAPVGTAAPTDVTTPWAVEWVDLGFADENGAQIVDSKTLEVIPVWQLMYPARRIITGRDFQAQFALRQWSSASVSLAFGGATVTVVSGVATITPPDPAKVDERAVGLEWNDDTLIYRLIIPRGLVVDNVTTKLARNAAADLPVTFGIIGQAGVAPWIMRTNDPAFPAYP